MSTIEKLLKSHNMIITTEGVFANTTIIVWDDLGIVEQARFKIDTELNVIYKFLGY